MENKKTCTKCKLEKGADCFSKNKKSKDALQPVCKECANKAALEYYVKNRALIQEKNKQNKKVLNERCRQYKANNKKKMEEDQSVYRAKNRVLLRGKQRAYYEKNSDACKAANVSWRERNHSLYRSGIHNRNARIKKNGGTLSKGLSDKLLILQKRKCACCKKSLHKFHMDHVIPIAKGGENTDSNIQLLCPQCNQRKSAKHPIDFMQERGFLL